MNNEKTVEIKKIVIKVGKKEIEFSLDEAKELQEILNDTLGEKETVRIIEHPIYVERPYHPWYGTYWTCSYNSGGTMSVVQNTSGKTGG